MTTQALTTITAASGPPTLNGWQSWLLSLAFGGVLFIGARAWDRARARAERDRNLADAYRRAAATTSSTAKAASTVTWTKPKPSQTAPVKRGRPAGVAPRQREVLEVLAAHPEGLTRTEIADAIGTNPNNASQALLRLHRRDRVERRLVPQPDSHPAARWFVKPTRISR